MVIGTPSWTWRIAVPVGVVSTLIALGVVVTRAVGSLSEFSADAYIALPLPAGEALGDRRNPEQLADLIHQFQRIKSLSFAADVSMVQYALDDCTFDLELPLGEPILGRFEYWAADGRYRANSYVDPDRLPGWQTQVAYDGRRFQLLLPNGVLSYSAQDSAAIVPGLPNPLLELLQFRYPLTDDTAHLSVQLKDVRGDQVPAEFFQVDWVRMQDGSRELERAVFPGGIFQGQSYVHHVYVLAGSRHMPVRIDRVSEGRVVSSVEFSEYDRLDSAAGPTFWPRKVILRTFTSDGRPAAEIAYDLGQIAVDLELPPEIFVIHSGSAPAGIWDDDRREFVTLNRQ